MIFTTIIHDIRKYLSLTCNEYTVMDTVYQLSNNTKFGGWCVRTKQDIADELDLSKQSIITIIKKLCTKGLIDKNEDGKKLKPSDYLRAIYTQKQSLCFSLDNTITLEGCYYDRLENRIIPIKSTAETQGNTVKKVYQHGKESLPHSVKKLDQLGKESLPYNNRKEKRKEKESKLVSKEVENENEIAQIEDLPTHQETFGLYEEKNNVAESLQQTDIPKSKSPYKAKEDSENADSDAEKVLFKYSMYADKAKLRQALDASLYEVCKLADAEWYAYRAMSWSDSKKVMLSNELWLNTIIKFISEDKSKGELRKKDTTANQDKPITRKKEIVW